MWWLHGGRALIPLGDGVRGSKPRTSRGCDEICSPLYLAIVCVISSNQIKDRRFCYAPSIHSNLEAVLNIAQKVGGVSVVLRCQSRPPPGMKIGEVKQAENV